jgi:endonuclease/exonuclease/phosphatase (EEP) superfamily protein YafD
MTEQQPTPPRGRRRSLLFHVALLAFVLFLAAAGLATLGRSTHVGELASNFRFNLGYVGGGLFLTFLCFRSRWLGFAALGLAVWLMAPEGALVFKQSLPSFSQEVEVSVLVANVLWHNRADRVESWLQNRGEDILLIQELSPKVSRDPKDYGYPHGAIWPPWDRWRASTWGLAIWSRFPIAETGSKPLTRGAFPALEAVLAVEGAELHLVNVHMPQALVASLSVRTKAWEALATGVDWRSHSFLAGDLNAATTSPFLEEFLETVSLRDSREGVGRQASWPSYGWAIPFRIAIDHALIGSGLRVKERGLVKIPGSDHLAVRYVLAVRKP